MRRSKEAAKWVLAAALLASMPMAQALANPPVAPTVVDKPGNIPPIPRGMPDLIPYHNFDPPKSPLFDLSKLTISGDMRVRAEFRSQGAFGTGTGASYGSNNDFIGQQWMRLGINYAISNDVDVFFQPQWSKNWGAANNTGTGAGCQSAVCANDAFNAGQGDSLFARQAFIMIRNLGVDGLSVKLGRQMVVMGNHRLFGHFDWANTGFSHDGITFQYNQPTWEFWGGWIRAMETDFNIGPAAGGAASSSFGVVPPGVGQGGGNGGFGDNDIIFARFAFKPIAGLAFEPLWVYQANNARVGGTSVTDAHANGQNRHTVGARLAYRNGMFDGTLEGYHQFGVASSGVSATGGANAKDLHINAYALAAEGGLTFASAPWSPRVGLEFNMASGDGDANCTSAATCRGTANTFENLYPTNHIVMGYADVMAWRNMVAYSASLQMVPFDYAANHLEFRYWNFQRQSTGDNWYRAAQNVYFNSATGNRASHLTDEVDLIYTLFFKGNKVAWQTGVSYLWAGSYLDSVAVANRGAGASAVNQTWGYTQIHVNF